MALFDACAVRGQAHEVLGVRLEEDRCNSGLNTQALKAIRALRDAGI